MADADNVAIVRSLYEAIARRDNASPFEVYADDIVWEIEEAIGVGGTYHGHEGVRRFWREWLSAFGEVDVIPEEFEEHGDRVVTVVRERGMGRASGAVAERRHYAVSTLRDGKIVRMQVFRDRADADAALAEPV